MSNLRSCQTCHDLTPLSDEGTKISLSAIARAATAGCDSCRLLRHAIHDCVPQALVPRRGSHGVGTVDVVIRQAIMRHFVEVMVRWNESNSIILDLFVATNTFNPWPSVRFGTPISGNTTSAETFTVVEKWLQRCLDNHASCRGSTTQSNPQRVLDLDAIQPDVVLCEPPPETVKYVCLSHCWGHSRIVTTTQANIAEFSAKVELSSLPRTFQEAIIFTRKLGIRYLWIDSLCIIQDSEEDWQAQSALMSSIYANSYITLAATGSSSDDGGLFFSHPKASIAGISTTGYDYVVHARPVIDHMDDAQFPLFKRAWVFQERLLAPRVLHFGRQELFWECNEAVNCECGGIFGERYSTGQEKFMSKTTHQEAFLKQELPHLRRRWHAIVEEYTQLDLTKMRDRLPALSGIAKQMASQQERQGSDYLAGLWSDTLGPDLLWYRQDAMSAKQADKWRAPSWSWANLEGQVRYFDAPSVQESPNTPSPGNQFPALKEAFLEVGEHPVRPANVDNTFGEVLSAHLRLRGPLTPVSIFDSRSQSSRTLQVRRHMMVRRQTFLRSAHYEFRFESSDSVNSFPFFADYDLQKMDANFATATFAAVRIAIDTSDDEYTMLLKRIHEEQQIWERVGLFTTKFTRWQSNDHKDTYFAAFAAETTEVEFTLV